jgi:8-oxo-dGTP diphosphatase
MGNTVDVVCFAAVKGNLKTVVVLRKNEPFSGEWVLPGGYVEIDELFETAARRELKEETGLAAKSLYPIGLFDGLKRDPRRRVVSHAYYALFTREAPPHAGDDAKNARWVDARRSVIRGFDHARILAAAIKTLRRDCLLQGRFRKLLPHRGGSMHDVLKAVLGSDKSARMVLKCLGADGGISLTQHGFIRALAPFAKLFIS